MSNEKETGIKSPVIVAALLFNPDTLEAEILRSSKGERR